MTRMTRNRILSAAALVALAGAARAAHADVTAPGIDAAAPSFRPSVYLAAMVGTTVAYRPRGGALLGPQQDLSPMAGVGLLARERLAVELDVGPTLVDGGYAGLSLMPGALWIFDPHLYAAARVSFVVDPEPNVGLVPGVGVTHLFDGGLAPFLEADLFSYVGQGEPDLGAALTIGATYTP